MINAEKVKEFARKAGADIIGIGSMTAFEGTAPENDPRFIAPEAKSIIGLGFRVLRGAMRGLEEKTQYYQMPEMGIVHIDEVYAPKVLREVCCFLEDNGYEGVVQRSTPDRRPASDKGNNPERDSTFKIKYARSVEEGKPAPDVLLDFNQAAVICSLGQMGRGGFVLNERFGPLLRFAFILTDAELETDSPPENLCDNCGKCIAACPGKAISPDGKLDEWQCTAFRKGAGVKENPFLSEDAAKLFPEHFDEKSYNELKDIFNTSYRGLRLDYNIVVCGLACRCACLEHLENKGVLKDKFVHKFRK
jgi:epoxyqueuosine reductase QueG